MGFVSVIKIVLSLDISLDNVRIFSSRINVYSVEN